MCQNNCSSNLFWKEDQIICQVLGINFLKKTNVLEGILGKIDKKTCHVSQILAIKRVELGEGLNPLKKEKLGLKSYKWKL